MSLSQKIFTCVAVTSFFCAAFFALTQYQQTIADFVLARHKQTQAALTGVTLNNGTGNLTIGADITSQTTALSPDIGAYRWTINGSNYMGLNMPFDGTSPQTDFSGNGNGGSVVGGAAYTTSGCKVGGCMVFNGTSSYINAGSGAGTQFGGSNASFSLEAWAKRAAANHADFIINQGPATTNTSVQLGYRVTNEFTFGFYNNDLDTAPFSDAGEWHHWVATYDGVTNERKIYRDGVLAASDVASADYTGTGDLIIGAVLAAPVYFAGSIDEVRVYRQELSAEQVFQNFEDGRGTVPYATSTDGIGGPTIIQSEETSAGQVWDLTVTPITLSGTISAAITSSNPVLITSGSSNITGTLDNPDEGSPIISSLTIPNGSTAGYRWVVNGSSHAMLNFPFNSGTTQTDISGASNHGTTFNSPTFTTSGCKVGNCLSFDGSNDRIEVASSSRLNVTGVISIEAWVNFPVSAVKELIDKNNNANTGLGAYQIFQNNQNISFRLVKGGVLSTLTSATSLDLNTWHHVAAVWDGATMRIYINGVQDANTLALAAPIDATTGKLIIGAYADNQFAFSGKLDEVRIYDRALSATQVWQNYQDGLNAVGGPTRITMHDHSVDTEWDLLAYEFLSDGSIGPAAYIDSATVAAASSTSVGVATPSGTQAGNITINYTCSNQNSSLRDLLVEYSTDGGGSFSSATIVSSTSGSVVDDLISMAECASGESSNSFVWNSVADSVALGFSDPDVRIRLTAQYLGGATAQTANIVVQNAALNTFTTPTTIGSSNTDYENEHIVCSGTTLTVDGTHTFESLTLQNNCTLTQTATSTTTLNRTILTVTWFTDIQSGSIINLVGRGYPSGYTAGVSGAPTTTGGATGNSGGSHGGYGYPLSGTAGEPYGSVYAPLYPGAGAANSSAGGGYIQLTTGSLNLAGTITVNAANGAGGANSGAGGAVWLTVTGALTGSGTISANGGAGVVNNFHGIGSGGRIAVYYNSSVSGNPTAAALYNRLQATTGASSGGTLYGAAGTVYIEDTSVHAAGDGGVYINNGNVVSSLFTPLSGSFGSIDIRNRGAVVADTLNASRDVLVTNNSILTHDFTTTATTRRLTMTVGGLTSVDSTSSISGMGRGYPSGYTADGSGNPTTVGGATGSSGGSHGGYGYPVGGTAGEPYDNIFTPLHPGAGAANSGAGGGYVKLTTGSLNVAGTINANGATAGGGANSGAGGGIWIDVSDDLTVTGTISANGGSGTINNIHGIGAGGRVAVYYNSSVSGNPTTSALANQLQAWSGTGSGGTLYGAAGTVYIEDASVHASNDGIVIINNNNLATSMFTAPSTPIGELQIKNRAVVRIATFTVNRDLTMTGTSTLTHDTTTTTTPYRIDLTVAGHMSVDGTSSVNVMGKGYPSGYTADGSGNPTTVGGATGNSGGSHGGYGYPVSGTAGEPYDSMYTPLHPGAGAANSGAGGGYVKIVASDLTLAGTINATAATAGGGANSGAGGGVWITIADALSISGTISANGGSGTINNSHGIGSGGRVAVYYNSSVPGNPTTSALANQLQAWSGTGSGGTQYGAAGTVYIEDASLHATNDGIVIINNNNLATSMFTAPSSPVGELQVKNRSVVRMATFTVNRDLTVTGTSTLTHDTTTTTTMYRVNLTVGGHMSVDGTSSVNVVGKGYPVGYTAGGSGNPTTTGGATGNSGGSHGGFSAAVFGATNTPYGSIFAPEYPGAGAANSGSGGGAVKITAEDFTLSGNINATAATAGGGANSGAGGSVWIIVNDAVSVTGTIAANGGSGTINNSHGIGSGGRIAFHYDSSVSGNPLPATLKSSMQAWSGTGSGGTLYGAAGTIYIEDRSQHSSNQGVLVVDNNNLNADTRRTPLFVVGQGYTTVTLDDLYVNRFGNLVIDTPCAGTPALTVNGITDTLNNGTITNNQSGTCTVTQAPINITTTALPPAPINEAYSQTIQSAGGIGPHTFVCRNGGLTVACTTVLPAGLDMNSSGVVSGTPTVSGVYIFTVQATEAAPNSGTDEQVITLSVGNAPTAPTVLFTHNTNAQLGNSNPSGIDASPVFSAVFNDPDVTEQALKYRVQVASDGGFSTLVWDSGASGTALSVACDQSFRCANINYAGLALSMNATTYYWRIKFWDELDFEGVFSATAQFTTDQAPSAPTNLFSNDSNAQSGLTNPVGVLAKRPAFSAVYNDPDIADVATQYRIQVSTTNNFSAIVWDSGAGGTNMASCNQGTRCADITFGGADLAFDETTYYWRIKFFDQAGVEGTWSEDPASTNTFKMGAGGSSIQRIQQQQEQDQQTQEPVETAPSAPVAGSVEVLGPNSARYNWIDTSNNETGFRILNNANQVIVEVGAGVTQGVEQNLPANSVVEGRSVVAFNSIGQSASSPFVRVITAAPSVRPVVRERGGNSVTFTVEPAVTVFPGQSAIRYELIITSPSPIPGQQVSSRTLTSEWIQSSDYTFVGIAPNDEVQVRVITRNQEGLQNEPTVYEDVAQLSRRFHVTVSVTEKGTNQLTRPIDPRSVLSVSMRVESIGTDPASSVILNLPLPRYITYRPNTLSVDGRAKNDAADGDGANADRNGVSASWRSFNPGESHTLSFELAFDVPDLYQLRQTSQPVEQAIAALVTAAANPLINLQASVTFAESDAVYMSPVITLEPNVELTEDPQAEPDIPGEEPVQVPTPEETEIIEQILQQEFGLPPTQQPQPQPGTQPQQPVTQPQPTLQTGETITSNDNGSFNVDVGSGDNSLGLTGSAEVAADLIKFTGSTTQPFTVITLIFNDSITAIAVSDANGFWQTFVNADRLGIQPGQEARVKIEAVAAKGELRSERVQVGDVTVSRGRSGDIEAEFDTTVSESALISVVEEIQHQVVKVVEKQEPVIQATLSVAAPVVVVSSVPLWGYLPYAPTLIYHAITYLVGLIGRKKRTGQRFYGVAYDSITKQPLALAIIRVYKVEPVLSGAANVGAAAATNKKLVTTIVTDKQGRYDALLEPGTYQLEVSKPQYLFPSQIVSTQIDGDFQHVYNNSQGIVVQGDQITIPDVPLDPINAQRQWQLATGPKKLWYAIQKVGNYMAAPILIVGSITSAVVVATIPDKPMNWIICAFYIMLLALQLRLRHKVEKAWGVVYDIATNAVLPLTTIQLIEPASSKVVTSRLSDYQGRFAFLPEPGTYVIKASKAGYQQVSEVIEAPQTDRAPLRGEVNIEKPDQRITGDIAMRQQA